MKTVRFWLLITVLGLLAASSAWSQTDPLFKWRVDLEIPYSLNQPFPNSEYGMWVGVHIDHDEYTGNLWVASYLINEFDSEGNFIYQAPIFEDEVKRVIPTQDTIFAVWRRGIAYTSRNDYVWQSKDFIPIIRNLNGSDDINFFYAGTMLGNYFYLSSGDQNYFTATKPDAWTGGLVKVSRKTLTVEKLYTKNQGTFPAGQALEILVDEAHNNLYIGTDEGVYVFNPENETCHTIFSEGMVRSIHWDYNRQYILAVGVGEDYQYNGKIYRINPNTKSVVETINAPYNFFGDANDVLEDWAGNIYVFRGDDTGSQYRDLLYYSPMVVWHKKDKTFYQLQGDFTFTTNTFTDDNNHPLGSVYCAYLDSNGDMWTGGTKGLIRWTTTPASAVEEDWINLQPNEFTLSQNYPNPFNAATAIDYSLSSARHVTLTVYDIRGRVVEMLVDGLCPAGTHRAIWSPGPNVPSGIYVVKLTGPGVCLTRKVGYVK